MAEHRFDLVVVGTGTGLDVANWAAEEGWRVAVVERGRLGGTCLNRGCIPSKLLIHSADVAETLRKAPLFGIHPNGFTVDFPALVRRVTESVDGDSDAIEEGLLALDNPKLFRGTGTFVGPKRLAVDGDVLVADKFLLAVGARPRIPPLPGLAEVPFLTSTEALRLEKLPASMVVMGGGYIALELAHFYGSLGTEVTIVQRHPLLARSEDEDVARALTAAYGRRFRLLLDSEAKAVSRDGAGVAVEVLAKDGRKEVVRAEVLLVAVGVTPNTDLLDLPATGVRLDARGFIVVDEGLETNVPGIFALGDAIGRHLFKHAANHEATYAIENLLDPGRKIAVDYAAMPHAIFGSPQAAGVGATERDLRRSGADYLVGRHRYRDTAMGHALEDHDGFVKLLVAREGGAILGCHIVGTEASTLLHEVVVAMSTGDGTVDALRRAIHVHPALPEVVQRAAGALAPPEDA